MYMEQARELYQAVIREFYTKDKGGKFREYAPHCKQDRESCFLWSYFSVTGMMYYAVKAGMTEILPFYKKTMEGLVFYRSVPFGNDMVKYHSERGETPEGGTGPCFFDDNIWVARNCLSAYELTGDIRYLDEAQRIVRYVDTGWNEELGGLVWNENGLTPDATVSELERGLSANACCIIVNAMLYELTGSNHYLFQAKKYYDFCKTVQDPVSKIYYNGVHTVIKDGVRSKGPVNRDLYGYNSGSMILADILLYRITNEPAYQMDALDTAKAAHKAFVKTDTQSEVSWYQDFTWFSAVLAEGFHELRSLSRELAESCFEEMEQSIRYAVEHYRKESGLLPHDYVTGWRNREGDDYDRLLLTHSGTAEIVFLLCMDSLLTKSL